MKKIILSAVFALVMVPTLASATTLNVVSDATGASYTNAVVKTADHLLSLQNANGGWDWDVTGQTSPSSATYLNVTGVTAESLLGAYALTGNSVYLDAAKKAGDFMVSSVDTSSPKKINGYNILFLEKLSEVSGVPSYSLKAAEYFGIIYSTTPTTLCASGCVDTAGLYSAYQSYRGFSSSTPNGVVAWDLAPFVEYANLVGDSVHAGELEATIVSNLSVATPAMDSHDLGFASGLKAASIVGDTANRDLFSSLLVTTDGSFGTLSDGKVQTTAYVLKAFKQTGDSRSSASADYLTATFSPTVNGWVETDGREYAEDESEAASAVALMLPQTVRYYSVQSAIDAAAPGDTVVLGTDMTVSSQVNIAKAITLDGNGHTLHSSFAKTDNSNNSAIGIGHDGVTIKNLTVDGTGGTSLHGINIYLSNDVVLDHVTVSHSPRTGINVNGSTVTINNVTTSNNGWGGINVDQGSGVTATTTLTVNGVSSHLEAQAAIWRDDNAKSGVTIVDTNNQYSSSTYVHDTSVTGTKWALKVTTVGTPAELMAALNNHLLNEILMEAGTADITFTAGTVITGTSTWDGIFHVPTVTTHYTIPRGDNSFWYTPSLAIELGAGDTPLTFDKPVKIAFAGQAGKSVGWSQNGTFQKITAVCDSDTNPTLAEGSDCKTDVGADLVVWTRHATSFVSFAETVIPYGNGGGNGGGSPSSSASPLAVLTTSNTPNTAGQVLGAKTTAQDVNGNAKGQVLGATAFAFTHDMKMGARGTEVEELQKMLVAAGHLKLATTTQYFGPLTKSALMKWQAKNNLPSTGYFGPMSRAFVVK